MKGGIETLEGYQNREWHISSRLYAPHWFHIQNKPCKLENNTHDKPQTAPHWHQVQFVHHKSCRSEPRIPSSLILVQIIMFKDQNVSLTDPLPSKSVLWRIFIWKNINSLFGNNSVVRVRSFSEVRRLVSFIVWLTHKGTFRDRQWEIWEATSSVFFLIPRN